MLTFGVFLIILHLCFAYTPPKFYPQGYHLDLFPDTSTNLLKGLVSINIATYAEPSNVVELDADPSIIIHYKSIKVFELKDNIKSELNNTKPVNEVRAVERVLYDLGTLRIHLSQKLQRDITYQIHISFETRLKNDSNGQPFFTQKFHDPRSHDERKFIVMDLTKNGCYKAFPCFNKLDYKCWIKLSVIRKSNFYALSTAPVNHTTKIVPDGSVVKDHFLATPPMSMSSFALVISDYRIINPFRSAARFDETNGISDGSRTELSSMIKLILRRIEERIGMPFPLPLFNVVMVPPNANIPYINAFGLLVVNVTSMDEEDQLVPNLIFDACRQWFIHVATPVSKNFTTHAIMTHLKNSIAEEMMEDLPANSLRKITYGQTSFMDLLQTPRTYSKVITSSTRIFEKFTFNMLDRIFPNIISQAMYKFLQKKEFKLYTDADILNALNDLLIQRNIYKTDIESLINVEEIIESWRQTTLVPIITIKKDYVTGRYNITQEPLLFLTKDYKLSHFNYDSTFQPPIVPLVISQSSNDFQTNHFVTWLSNNSQEVDLASEFNNTRHFIVNPGHLGPFVVNYEEANWQWLTENFQKLPTNIQLQLLVDSLVLAKAEIMNYNVFLAISSKLQVTEEKLELWALYSALIESFADKFHGEVIQTYQEFISRQATMYNRITDDKFGKKSVRNRKLIAQTKSKFNCFVDKSFCFATRDYETLMYEATTNKRLTGKQNCEVVKNLSLTDWQMIATGLFHTSRSSPSQERSQFLYLLSCTEHPLAFETYMNLLLLNFNKSSLHLTAGEQIYVITQMDDKHLKMLMNFLKKNFYLLKDRLSKDTWRVMINNIIRSTHTREDLKKIEEFKNRFEGQFESAAEVVEQSLQSARSSIEKEMEYNPLLMQLIRKAIDNIQT